MNSSFSSNHPGAICLILQFDIVQNTVASTNNSSDNLSLFFFIYPYSMNPIGAGDGPLLPRSSHPHPEEPLLLPGAPGHPPRAAGARGAAPPAAGPGAALRVPGLYHPHEPGHPRRQPARGHRDAEHRDRCLPATLPPAWALFQPPGAGEAQG